MQFDGFQHRQPLGGEHDDERALLRITEHLAQPVEALAATVEDLANTTVAIRRSLAIALAEYGLAEAAIVLAEVLQHLAEARAALLPAQQAFGPGAHHFRQRHQPCRVPGRGGIEHQQVVVGQALLQRLGDAFEQRRLVHSRGIVR